MNGTDAIEIVAKAPNEVVSKRYQIQLGYHGIESVVRWRPYMEQVGHLCIAVRPDQAEAARGLLRGSGHMIEREVSD